MAMKRFKFVKDTKVVRKVRYKENTKNLKNVIDQVTD